MQVAEVFLSVCLTVIGSVIIALVIHKGDEMAYKKRLFKALYHEIEWNLSRIQKLLDRRKHESSSNRITVSELHQLLVSSYQSARLAGELFTLCEEIRDELDEAYGLIEAHNRIVLVCESVPVDGVFWDRTIKIEKKLQNLRNELPKSLKYLRRR